MKPISIFLVAAVIALLTGCATINSMSATAGVVENTTVQYVTAQFISKAGATPALQLARAQKVKAIAVEIQGVDNGTVTLAQLEAALTADIAKLPVPDQILAGGLVQALIDGLGVQTQTGVLNTAVKAQINVVMNDVILACALYGA